MIKKKLDEAVQRTGKASRESMRILLQYNQLLAQLNKPPPIIKRPNRILQPKSIKKSTKISENEEMFRQIQSL